MIRLDRFHNQRPNIRKQGIDRKSDSTGIPRKRELKSKKTTKTTKKRKAEKGVSVNRQSNGVKAKVRTHQPHLQTLGNNCHLFFVRAKSEYAYKVYCMVCFEEVVGTAAAQNH